MVGVTGFKPATHTFRTLPKLTSLTITQSLSIKKGMASMAIRDIDDRRKAKLRLRAAHRGHSMEEEVREILRTALE